MRFVRFIIFNTLWLTLWLWRKMVTIISVASAGKDERIDDAFLVNDDDHHNEEEIIVDRGDINIGGSIAERRAFDVSTINATSLSLRPTSSHRITIPPGIISPSMLLPSPLLPNDQVPSPTTGTLFQFNSTNSDSLNLKRKHPAAYETENSNFTPESATVSHVQNYSDPFSKDFTPQNGSPCQTFEDFKYPIDFQEMANNNGYADSTFAVSDHSLGNNWSDADSFNLQPGTTAANQVFTTQNDSNGKERSKNLNREKQQKGSSTPKEVKYSEDGYYWRKYGQKQVKGSEYPRSYFKCTNTNCMVKKKVERSHDGHITEIVYKGDHNHPQPQPEKQFSDGVDINGGICVKSEVEVDMSKDVTFGSDWRNDGQDSAISRSLLSECATSLAKPTVPFEGQEFSSVFGNQEGDDKDEASHDSISFNADEASSECEPKRRKRDSYINETSTVSRSNREPRVVVQIESEIDILDDGYRWRKYGQKVVKGNPNPRSYYKCTTPGCPVRKHVERAADNIKNVITTYEGKHNHEVPSSKNSSSLVISEVSNLSSTVKANGLSPQMVHKADHLPRTGIQAQDLHLYMDPKQLLNYEFMRTNLSGSYNPSGHNDFNFGASSLYHHPSYPPLPTLSSLSYSFPTMNTNPMKTYPMYPMLSDSSMAMPTPMSHVAGPGIMPPLVNGYTAVQSAIRGQEVRQQNIMKQEQEQMTDGGFYDTSSLSMPNHGN